MPGMSERLLAFEAVENFRDYGDYATAAGRRLHRGRLLRSGHHNQATDADLERLHALGVAVVVDLRRPSERALQPSRRHGAFAGSVIESDLGEPDGEAPHITFLRTTDLTAESVAGFMTDTYRRMPFDERLVDLFSRYFNALAEAEGAVLIHCAAGKDRTGLLAALTHHAAGVDDEDVLADYLLTNRAVNLEARAPEIAERLHRHFGRRAGPEAVAAFMGVEEAWLRAAFAEIKDRCGSIDGYLESVLGVDAAHRERLEATLCA